MCLQDWVGGGYRVQGARDSTNQRRVYVDQSERRSSKLDQSEPSSQNAMRGTDGIKGTVPSFLPFPSVIRTRHHVNLGADIGEHTKTRLLRLESRSQVPFLQGVIEGYCMVAPPIVNIRPTAAELPAFNTRR